MSVQVTDVPEQSRFEISVDGALAGFAAYQDHSRARVFTHTEIDDAFGGQGLGSQLVRAALDDARSNGLRIKPACPFFRAFIEKHPEYADLT